MLPKADLVLSIQVCMPWQVNLASLVCNVGQWLSGRVSALYSVVTRGDHDIHYWRNLIKSKQLSSVSVCHTQVFARFSGHGNSIYKFLFLDPFWHHLLQYIKTSTVLRGCTSRNMVGSFIFRSWHLSWEHILVFFIVIVRWRSFEASEKQYQGFLLNLWDYVQQAHHCPHKEDHKQAAVLSINHCWLFNAKSYSHIKYVICNLISSIYTVKWSNSSISNNSI